MGYGMNSSAYEATTISSNNATSPFNNFRSLIPGQIYSFYIHYIRKDGSATNGFIVQNEVDEKVINLVQTKKLILELSLM